MIVYQTPDGWWFAEDRDSWRGNEHIGAGKTRETAINQLNRKLEAWKREN